jgi:CheY-like chemotaxis protein
MIQEPCQPSSARDLVRASPTQLAAIIQRLKAGARRADGSHDSTVAAEQRIFPVTLTVTHLGGNTGAFIVRAYAISARWMSVVHGGYVHVGSTCTAWIPTKEGEHIALPAVVQSCRHLDGTLHDLSLQFERPIDPEIAVAMQTSTASAGDRDKQALKGRLLYVDESESDRLLMAHFLSGSSVVTTMLPDIESAVEVLHGGPVDAVFTEIAFRGRRFADCFLELKQALKPPESPIMAVTAETDGRALADAKQAGVAAVLAKPYSAQELLGLLKRVLIDEEFKPEGPELITSELANDAAFREMISHFVSEAHTCGELLGQATTTASIHKTRELCVSMRRAASYGFPMLSGAAEVAVKNLDATGSVSETIWAVQAVIDICARLTDVD